MPLVGATVALCGPLHVNAQTARILPKAIEAGIDASMITTEGIAQGTVRVRGGSFVKAIGGLAGLELSGGYRHLSSLDAVDAEACVSWQESFRGTSNYPYVCVGGGVRYEDIGSFSQVLYPVGIGLGVRSLFGPRSALRVEYRVRRVLNDPVADFSEHSIMIGLSVFFMNSPSSDATSKEAQ
jgi:hypothetical protein